MGTYLNPGNQNFRMSVNSAIFVDKSDMIQYLNTLVNTQQRFVSVSRPRRFGKTMAADMICAYYDREADSRELFASRKLAACSPVQAAGKTIGWDVYLGKFDVIRLVMTRFFRENSTVREALDRMQELVIRDFRRKYPEVDFFGSGDLLQTIEDVYSENGRQLVFVIDEWDAPFRAQQENIGGQTEYLNFLRDLLKDNNHIALAYLTGILPIKKYGEHSALNMFTEYSMMAPRQLAQYTGFTEDEVIWLSKKYHMDYEEVSNWYDGYLVSDQISLEKREQYREGKYQGHKISIYSPLSVVECMTTGQIRNYWNKTETYEALAEFIRRDYDGLKEAVALLMDGGRLRIDTATYQNDMTTFHNRDDVLSLLIHLGYLGFDDDRSEVFIPNREILDEFKTSTKGREWDAAFRLLKESQEILTATWRKDSDKVARLLEAAHNRAGNKTYHDEAALSYAVQLAYYAAQKYYSVILEMDSGKGYADIVYLPSPQYPDIPALLIELKYDKGADTALSQIKRQDYPARLEHYKGNILLVAIDYSKDIPNTNPDFKHHSCRIEEA